MNLEVRENIPFQVILAQLEGDQSIWWAVAR